MAYLLDADVFIQAKNLHYGLDFCPAFWEWLTRESSAGRVLSIEKVYDELQAVQDDLSVWASARGDAFFRKPETTLLAGLRTVSAWATGQNYEPVAVNTFLQSADYYLVATGLASNHTVVTHEVTSNSLKKIKIPDACIGLGVKCVNPYEMLRYSRARFVLPSES
jgi:hypothetical protein